MNLKRDYQAFDFLLLIMVCALIIFGIIVIGSATHINVNGPSKEYTNQKIFFATGLVFLIMATLVDYHFIAKFYIPIYAFTILILVVVLFLPQQGDAASPARWIQIGKFTIQPSEFAKIFIIISLAKWIDKQSERINNVFVLSSIVIAVVVPVVLIKIQPSMSASLVVAAVPIFILFVAGLSYRYILAAILLVVPAGIFFYIDLLREKHLYISKFLKPYQIDRIMSFINPNPKSGNFYQTNQSIHAIGSGMLSGKGIYHGTVNQLSYLPENHNDFIFSVVGEEFGFIGCMIVFGVVMFIIFKCIIIAQKAPDVLGKLIASGVASMFLFQAFVNVGVATGILPNTGMPFPFLSSGGSSLWMNMMAVGLVLNVGLSRQKSIFEG